jgi:glycerol-3-phosphate dehydrogenase
MAPQPGAANYDLIIVGGGINGAGIARDAGLRGLRTLLLEAGDFGSGTSSWSTRLIHGGLRYLEYGEIPLVRESLHERRRLQEQAPHLVKPLRLTIPVYKGAKRGKFIIRLGMLAYDLLSLGRIVPGHRMLSAKELLEEEPGLEPAGLEGGAQYYDAQVTFAERLVLENVLDAVANGVDARNYTRVIGLEARQDEGHRVTYRDGAGASDTATAPVVVNAAGPWVDQVLASADRPFPRLMGGTKGSHIVVGDFAGAPVNAVYMEAKADGRPLFVVPWNEQYLIGTTDIRIDGDPADAQASDEEIAYLLDETNRVFPDARLTPADVHFSYAGVRPLPYKSKGPESAITRRHIIQRHEGAARGVLSLIGGKLTTYRSLAEQTVDTVFGLLGRAVPGCKTGDRALPGGVGFDRVDNELDRLPQLSDVGRRRLQGIYGSRVGRIADLCDAAPALAALLDESRSVLAAEVILAVREEFARTLTDLVYRRLLTGLAADLDERLTAGICALAARELGWSDEDVSDQLSALRRHGERLRRAPASSVSSR